MRAGATAGSGSCSPSSRSSSRVALARAGWLQGVRAQPLASSREPAAARRVTCRPHRGTIFDRTRRPARDRRAGDDGLRRPAPGPNPSAVARAAGEARARRRTSSTGRCRQVARVRLRGAQGRPGAAARLERQGASAGLGFYQRGAARLPAGRGRRRTCSATRASTTRASPGSSCARPPARRPPGKRDDRPGRRSAARSTWSTSRPERTGATSS